MDCERIGLDAGPCHVQCSSATVIPCISRIQNRRGGPKHQIGTRFHGSAATSTAEQHSASSQPCRHCCFGAVVALVPVCIINEIVDCEQRHIAIRMSRADIVPISSTTNTAKIQHHAGKARDATVPGWQMTTCCCSRSCIVSY